MADSTSILSIVLQLKDQASSQLSQFQGTLKSMEPQIKAVTAAGAIGFAAVSGAVYESIQAANESAKVQAQLGAVLKSTGNAAGLFADDILDQAKALQNLTTYDDEAITSTANLLLTFKNIKGAVFQEALPAILDMSTAMGQDLQSSAIQVGKALNDPVAGMSALQRVGVTFSEAQKNVIQSLVDTGQTAKAQQLIIQELNSEFGGSAAAAAGTFSGQMAQLKNELNDTEEEIGKALIPTLISLIQAVKPIILAITEWVSQHPKLTQGIIIVAAATTGLITVIGGLTLAFIALDAATLPYTAAIAAVVVAIAALIAIGVALYQNWDRLKEGAMNAWTIIKSIVMDTAGAITLYVIEKWSELKDFVVGIWNAISDFTRAAWDLIKTIIIDIVAFIVGSIILALNTFYPRWRQQLQAIYDVAAIIFTAIQTFILKIWDATVTVVMAQTEQVTSTVKAQFDLMKDAISAVLGALSAAWQVIWKAMGDYFNSVWDDITNKIRSAVDFVAQQIQRLQSVMAPVSGLIGSVGGSISSAFSGIMGTGKSVIGVHDAVITPQGQVITTDPADYLIATKTPGSFGGSGITINIYGDVTGKDLVEKVKQALMQNLRLDSRFSI